MRICKYESGLLNTVTELLKEEEQDPQTNAAYNIELFNNNYGDFYKQFLAFDDKNELIGCIVISVRLYTTEINFIYVNEKLREQGIATQLMNYTEQYAKEELKSDGIIVNTAENNIKSQNFYKKSGYKEVGKVFDYFNHGIWQIFYHKKL